MSLVAGKKVGRYSIRTLLGKGGMGNVYLAEDSALQRLVALKLLPNELTQDAENRRRFVQEAHAASALNHHNIVTIYEIGHAAEFHFISMEYVQGVTLREQIVDSPIDSREALRIAVEIASALEAAHRAGIVHRDIKPENIMLRDDGYLKVLDFGIAKVFQNRDFETDLEGETRRANITRPGTILGTVAYMSPEQVRGQPVDARTDIWSLGVVLYEMITGKLPFDGLTASDIMAAILRAEPPPIGRFVPKAPSGFQRIVTKALSKEVSKRYKSSEDMLADFRRFTHEIELGSLRERCAEILIAYLLIL